MKLAALIARLPALPPCLLKAVPPWLRQRGQSDRGAVLVDVLTSMGFVLLLVGLTQTWARAVLYSQKTLETVAVANQDAALALEAVARDIRNAGFGVDTPLIAAGRDYIELTADHNADGDVADAHELVRYAYRADRKQVTRASGQSNPQPFAGDVAADGLRFSFKDKDENDIHPGPTGVDEADLPRIRRIDIELALEFPNPDPRAIVPIRAAAALAIALRNR